ncbi:MAG: hypothetical protein R3B97_01575 [Dehalococcoidia bacterium]|nr:hypothetical protein [Dehalococcoidia bacterium]MCB9486260.1 hypothetical protein [Thermoflexaceae bacterium]
MIVLLEEPETWSLMMVASAVAIDNADLSPEGVEAIRRWRSDNGETSTGIAELTDAVNKTLNARLDAKFLRRIKTRGSRAESVRK